MATGIIGLLILTLCILLFITEWLPAVVTGALGCLMMVLFQVCTLEEAFSGFSKYVLMFDMLAGRLELLPILVLVSPRTWKRC